MKSHHSRRSFLGHAATAIAAPAILPASVFGQNAPSKQVTMGFIGMGNRGIGVMLTITTLTLTITGFSGPKIAASGTFAQTTMVLGILSVLASTLLILGGSLRIQWVTQFTAENDLALVTSVVRYRNKKTKLFFAEICLLVAGLTCYVASVVMVSIICARVCST